MRYDQWYGVDKQYSILVLLLLFLILYTYYMFKKEYSWLWRILHYDNLTKEMVWVNVPKELF